jgi:hypothetical protein
MSVNDAIDLTSPAKTIKRERSENRIGEASAKRSKIADADVVDLSGYSDEENL